MNLPHSPEAERAVLASVLLKPQEYMPLVGERLKAEQFYLERHHLIYRAMTHVWVDRGADAIDIRTIQAALEENDDLDKAGGLAYLFGLDQDLPNLSNVESYIGTVLDRWRRRRVIEMAQQAIQSCREESDPELLGRIQAETLKIQQGADPGGGYQQAAEGLIGLDLERSPGEAVGLATGLTDLDAAIQGLEPGCLYVIGGRPGHGKTSLALTILRHLAIRSVPCGMVSLEMMIEQLSCRLLSMVTGISHSRIRTCYLTAENRQQIASASQVLCQLPLWIDATSTQTPEMIAGRAHRLKIDRGIKCLAIDYLGLISGGGGQNETERHSEISRRCKLLAKDLGIPVLLLHQVGRACDGRSDRRPILSDLRQSGQIEADADVVAFCYREVLYSDAAEESEAELVIRKNRNGIPCRVPVYWDGPTMEFRNLAR